ncbi:MAG: dethiobiotin synthase [Candidatus Omnitrophica bacterium CG11_big_fil_rev_8_21_14_0_20_43_6]|nr:MAG: dethiobiotin synthase [Candidatus Omnitrophica bacterium CG11_big_fil_rev_8_21_14_0_20_43_6]
MRGVFVTGTDTGVGKSIVTGLLAKYLREKGYKVVTQKWVQTGSRFSADINLHLKIMGVAKGAIKDHLACVCPYVFKLPASPHLAAKVEKKKIETAKIKQSFKLLSSNFDFVIVEGIGGALVPVNEKCLVIDIAKELGLPVLVVAQNKLGVINHLLMTVEALKHRKMKILGIIFNNCKGQHKLIVRDNPEIIRKITGEKILGVLPWNKKFSLLYKKFRSIAGEMIR